MVLPTVLKRRHSLKDINILPVIRRIRLGKPSELKGFARVQKDVKTDALSTCSMAEINTYVNNITGEQVGEVLMLAGLDDQDIDAARWALHCVILYANEFGQPKGQDLADQDQVSLRTICLKKLMLC